MADKLNLDIEVGGVEQSINSIKDLKNAIKDARNEQVKAGEQFGLSSKQYEEASKRVSQLKDKVEDLGDSTRSLQGSGIERASQGFNQLGEGLRNLDFDKVKVGLTAIKSALAATGIMLIVQGVMYLIENFDELSKGSGLLAKALRFVGDIVTVVTDYIYKFTDALGITNSELDKMGDATVENANKAKDALASQTAEYDRQIAVAKASGKSAIDLEMAKQQAIIETNKALIEQTIAFVRAGGELDAEQKKLLTEQLNAIKDAVNTQKVIQITHTEDLKKENQKRLDDNKKYLEDLAQAELDAWNKTVEIRMSNTEAQRLEEERLRQEKLAADKAAMDESLAYMTEVGNQEQVIAVSNADLKKELRKQELDDFKKNYNAQLNTAQSLTNSLQSLSDSYFYFKRKNLEKGSKEDLKQAKKQFDINKGLSIASATISGIQGVINALSAQSVIPEPFGAILKGVTAVAIGAAAAANIAKIASSKFDENGGGGGGGSTAAAVAIPSAPSISMPDANVSGTKFDESGKKIEDNKQQPITVNVKAQVVESEMTQSQQNVSSIKDKSTF
jgi:hypothetical protein